MAGRIAELQPIITARHKALRDSGAASGRLGHDIVVVLDGSRRLRSLPGAIAVLREGGQAGVYCICLDTEERLLPAECQAVVAPGPDGALVVQQMSQPPLAPVRPEYVTPSWAHLVARSIAPVRDTGDQEDAAGLLASLAVANRPDAMTFVLVDYKGGSAFSGCVDLPHVAGMVTDLDAHLTRRALASLLAELIRRERILSAAGVKDIDDYTALATRRPAGRHCPGW